MVEKNKDAPGDPKADVQVAPAEDKPAAPPKKTPVEWADALGFMVRRNPKLPQSVDAPHWSYAAAEKLFGWADHAYHYQAEADRFELSEKQFRFALKCAGDFPACELPEFAVPNSQKERLSGHVPARVNGS